MKRLINIEIKKNQNIISSLFNIISPLFIAILILFWEVYCKIFDVPKYLIPMPSNIVKELIRSFPLLIEHSKATILEVAYGFLISIVLAIIISLAMDRFYIIKKIVYPILVITQTIPLMAIGPLLMIWFGFGYTPKIIIVVLICFFPITINLTEGLGTVDKELIELMTSLKATSIQIFFKCKLPVATPSFFAGLRIAATYSVAGAVISEWLGAKKGLGIFMVRVMKSYRVEALFAVIIFVIVLTLIFVGIIDIISKIIMPYNKQKNRRN